MNFVSRFAFRVQGQIFRSYIQSRSSVLKFSTSSQLFAKHGKLINDHVTNAFYLPIGEEESDMAAVAYEKQKGLLNLQHTAVPKHLEGQGIENDIAKEVFEYCSARNLKVLLSCELLQKFYKENPQYKDLVVKRENLNI